MTTSKRIGIDLGGTKIEAVIIAADGEIVNRERLATPQDDYAAILDTVAALVASVATNLPGNTPVGIGTPGSVSSVSGLLRNSNSTCLNGKPLRHDLEQILSRPVRLANDADCFTLSEASDGAARDATNVFGVILGTGVGGGLCVGKQIIQGVNGLAGEWGHNPLSLLSLEEPGVEELGIKELSVDEPSVAGLRPEPGRLCFCGRRDCHETWLSGPGFSRTYFEQTGRNLSAKEIVRKVEAGDSKAMRTLDQYCELLALGLSSIINVFDPETIVLGGGMSNTSMIYEDVPRRWGSYVFSEHVDTKIVPAAHGDSSGVRGAAWLWPITEA